jgi:hypothetical protein
MVFNIFEYNFKEHGEKLYPIDKLYPVLYKLWYGTPSSKNGGFRLTVVRKVPYDLLYVLREIRLMETNYSIKMEVNICYDPPK